MEFIENINAEKGYERIGAIAARLGSTNPVNTV